MSEGWTIRSSWRDREGVHPVIGLWPITLASAIEDFLKHEKRKVRRFAEEVGAIEVYFPKTEIGGVLMDPFFNINEPEELAKAEMLLKERAR